MGDDTCTHPFEEIMRGVTVYASGEPREEHPDWITCGPCGLRLDAAQVFESAHDAAEREPPSPTRFPLWPLPEAGIYD